MIIHICDFISQERLDRGLFFKKIYPISTLGTKCLIAWLAVDYETCVINLSIGVNDFMII